MRRFGPLLPASANSAHAKSTWGDALVPLLVVSGFACSRHSPAPGPVVSLSGNYRFVEHPPTITDAIAGVVVIRGDTLIVVPETGLCDYEPHASQHDKVIAYTCGAVTLRFDRRDPIGAATFEATATIQPRLTCDPRQRTCARSREDVPASRTVTGKLHLKRIDEAR